jgi:hypothetical protein
MSQVTLAKEIANDRTDVRASAWSSYEALAVESIQTHFPDLTSAEVEAAFGPAIMHFMVGLYYEANDVDEIHLSSAKHHFQKYDSLLQDFHPSSAHYDQYISEATASLQAKFPDLTTVATVFAGAIVSYCISRFYEKNGVGDKAAKASYFMGLYNNDVAGYQPKAADLTQYEAEAIASLANRFPDISNTSTRFASAIKSFALGRFYGKNGEDADAAKAAFHMGQYQSEVSSFQPLAGDLTQYESEAAAALAKCFPDISSISTRFASAIRSFALGRFFGKNGDDADTTKSAYYMGLYQKEISSFQPASADLTQYEAEAKASLESRFPDIGAIGIPVRFASAIKNFALGRFFGKNGDDADTTKSAYYMGKFESEVASFQPKESEYSIFISEAQVDLLSRRPYLTSEDIQPYQEALKYYAQAKFWERNGGDKKRNESRLFYQKYREMT